MKINEIKEEKERKERKCIENDFCDK